MPKKRSPEKPEEQSKRFKHEAEKLIDAGELDPIDAERRLDRLFALPEVARRTRF